MILLISGCINLQKKDTTQVSTLYKGTSGLKLSFVKNAPPSRVFENTNFNVIVKIENKGAYDVRIISDIDESPTLGGLAQRGLFVITPESGYVDFGKIDESEGISPGDKSAFFEVRGKSLSNPVGDDIVVYSNLKARKLGSLSQVHSSTVFATVCYPYQTKLSTSVCIDPDIYNLRPGKKACEVKNLAFSGQGAPVAITKVDVQMVPEGDKVKPLFLLYIENKGDGEVVKRDSYFDACGAGIKVEEETDQLYKYFNVINIYGAESKLSDIQLVCEQGDNKNFAILRGKKGVVKCYPSEWKDENENAYLAPLSIVLDYGYTSTISKQFDIEKPLK